MLIALNGRPRVGKTTFARIAARDPSVKVLDLSGPFKTAVHRLFNVNFLDHQKDQPQVVLGGRPPRNPYIDMANLGEKYDPCIWVRRAVREQYDPDRLCVLDQVGKPQQFDWIRKNVEKFCFVRVLSNRVPIIDDGRVLLEPEEDVFTVINNWSLNEYHKIIAQALLCIKEKY